MVSCAEYGVFTVFFHCYMYAVWMIPDGVITNDVDDRQTKQRHGLAAGSTRCRFNGPSSSWLREHG